MDWSLYMERYMNMILIWCNIKVWLIIGYLCMIVEGIQSDTMYGTDFDLNEMCYLLKLCNL